MLSALVSAAVLVAALAVELALVITSPATVGVAAVLLWVALPGPFLVTRLLGEGPESRAAGLVVGPVLGLASSTLVLLGAWTLGLPALVALMTAPLPVWLLSRATSPCLAAFLRLPRFTRADWIALSLLLLVVPATTIAPYARVAEPLADGGRAYRAYFTADFVWAMTVSAELAKQEVPPANPFLQGEGLNYYWLSHLLSGANYRAFGPLGARLEEVILLDGLGYGVAFVGALYWLARAIGVSPAGAAVGSAAGFVANSYEGLERLLVLREYELPLDSLRVVNIDAVSRWFYKGMPVDGLQRLLLYQPHHLTGYALALLAVWLVARATSVRPPIVALGAGVLLGAGFLYSTFTAIIVGVAVGMLFAVRIARERAWRTAMWSAPAAGAPIAVAVALSVVLGYVNPAHGSLLHFGPNPVAFHEWPFVLLLNFGPLLLLGIAGVLVWRWSGAEAAPAAALAVASLGFYFFADVPDMGGVWVGWRAGHLLIVALGLFAGVALDALWRTRGVVRGTGVTTIALLCAAGVPTVAIDVFNAQDVDNRESAPLFPWTLILSRAEIEGLDWIRRSTPADAIVQVDPRARNAGTWAYIPAFAERRMYAGLPISMIPLRRYQWATDNVSFGIFRASTAKDAAEMARFLGIDYMVVGDPERRSYPEAVALFEGEPRLFRQVFRNEALTVYQVAANGVQPEESSQK